jgi:damage-control phosphatase, subfamily I
MKTYLDCYHCFARQALEAARMVGASADDQFAVLSRVFDRLSKTEPLHHTPPQIGGEVHAIVREVLGEEDPYREAKATSTQEALAVYPQLKTRVAGAPDPLEMAVRLSIAGNIIDYGPTARYDLWDTVERVSTQPFAVDDSAAFREKLHEAETVLYLADNAGETVFDRVLIEQIDVPVFYAVKAGPVLNDATLEDALAAGLDQAAEIISTGSNMPGTVLSLCSDQFRQRYEEATFIIAKGQANYETLSEEGERVFCLLQAKCPVIADDIGVPVGSVVLMQGR